MMGLKEFSYKNNIDDESRNLMGILVNGAGVYPTEFFSQEFSYKFDEFRDVEKYDNKQLFVYLMNLLEKKGYNVFVRNVSFLGFPSYHIIVPGLSEIDEIDGITSIEKYAEYNKIKRYIRNVDNIPDKEIEEIISFFKNANYNSGASIVQFLNLPVKNVFPWYYTGTRIDNLNEKETIGFLSIFYPLNIINAAITDFGNPEQIFNRYGKIKCWNCKECELKTFCSYDSVENVYKTLKEKYALIKR